MVAELLKDCLPSAKMSQIAPGNGTRKLVKPLDKNQTIDVLP